MHTLNIYRNVHTFIMYTTNQIVYMYMYMHDRSIQHIQAFITTQFHPYPPNSLICVYVPRIFYQAQTVPAIMLGRDIIGVARTGSGKTLAFLLPMIRHVRDQPQPAEGEGPIALIMAPARELAVQIYREARKLAKPMGLRVACVYGGSSVREQIAQLKAGASICVCTPGRMIDVLCMNSGRLVGLSRVTYVVLDEADRMFDMGFEPQITRILNNTRPDRQTVLFSATFPRHVESLARKVLTSPIEIVVGGRSVASSSIQQYVEIMDPEEDGDLSADSGMMASQKEKEKENTI